MKNFFKLSVLVAAFATIGLVSCKTPIDEPVTPTPGGNEDVTLTAEFATSTPSTATLSVKTEGLSRIAYTATRIDNLTENEVANLTAPIPMVIFATDTTKEVSDGTHEIVIENLAPNAEYVVFLIGEIASNKDLMAEAVKVEGIKTNDFSDDFTLRDVHYRGFTMDVRVPERVKEEDHLIKWATSDLYLYRKNGGGTLMPDASCMELHDKVYGQFFFNTSTSLIVDEEHSWVYAEDGSIDTYLYEAIVPGQPQIFILGEFEFGESHFGWGYGYYKPMFNQGAWVSALAMNGGQEVDQAPYWTGMYRHELIQIQKPEPLPEEMIDITYTTRPDDATVTITADPSLDLVAVMILDQNGYDVTMNFLDHNEDYLQWYATSYVGMMEGASMTVSVSALNGKPLSTKLSEFFLQVDKSSHFWVHVVGMRGDLDGDGNLDCQEQVHKVVEFDLPKATKPAPELIVTALESDPLTAKYSIKCPTGDAVEGYWMANYEKDWLMTGMTAEEIIKNYAQYSAYSAYYTFTPMELALINLQDEQKEGLVIEFPSRPNENFHFAALISNDEGTETCSDAVICHVTDVEVERIESAYFESLKGDWTASAKVKYSKYNESTEEYDPKEGTHTSKVTIGDIEYPAQLPESVYETFAQHGVTDRALVDEYYKEFCEGADVINQYTRSHNRMIANGFNFAGEMLPYLSYFNYQSAYDLFISDTYNGYTNTMPIYDFGPKWYIEVMEDGTLAVPFNTEFFAPAESWATDAYGYLQEAYLIAYDPAQGVAAGYLVDAEGNPINGYFPVEVSEDGNTLTIKPYVSGDYTLYPNLAIWGGGSEYTISINVVSEITLTRGQAAGAAAMAPARNNGSVGAPEVSTIHSQTESKGHIRPKKRGVFGEVKTPVTVGIDHSATPEQRGQQWFNVHRNAGK